MKRLIIIEFFINLLLITGYTQGNGSIKIDTTNRDFSQLQKQNDLIPLETEISIVSGDSLKIIKGIINFEEPINGINRHEHFNENKTYDNMPCWKPQGFFEMMILKPDTNIRYTMLLKRL